MNKTLSIKLIPLLALSMLPLSAFSVQPMSESDLEIVSAETGKNILNIFGASQAGLSVDSESGGLPNSNIELDTENSTEGESTKAIALNELKAIEEDSFQNLPERQQEIISKDSRNTVLKLSESTKGSASVFETNSEINYKNNNVHHDMRTLKNGGVAISRDLQIDLLKLENLRGDSTENGRSAGNIYLSDWSSRGDTRIISTQ